MVKPRNALVLKKTKEGGQKKTEKGEENAKPQGSPKPAGLTGCHFTKTQSLAPINELHKLQLKPWALI